MPARGTERAATRPGQPAAPTVLVVDDDRKIVRLVAAYLEREGYRVVTAYDGREAVARARAEHPALIVLDLMLPEIDGLEVLRLVRRDADVPVLMLSARSSLPDRIRGIEKGADDYLPKPFSPAELVVRVKAILRRAASAPDSGTTAGTGGTPSPTRRRGGATQLRQHDLVIDLERYEVRQDGVLVTLTPVEFRLLAALVAAEGRALTRDQLLDAVYGSGDADILDRTIDVHVGRLRDKLADDADQPRYVMTVRGVGYRAAPPPGSR